MFKPLVAVLGKENSSSQHINAIDGLRGFACLIVVSHHCYFHAGRYAYPVISLGSWKIVLSGLLFYGYSGVELFFVLSGFCLTYPIFKRSDQSINWIKYFVKRFRRIYPPFLAAMLLFGVLSLLIQYFKIELFFDLFEVPTFRHLLLSLSFVSLSFNTSFWTLCVEWRWYFILPLLIVAFKRFKIRGIFVLAIAVSLIYSLFIQHSQYQKIQFILSPLPLYLPVFALGIWAAELTAERSKPLANRLFYYAQWGCLASFVLCIVLVPSEPNLDFSYARIVPFSLLYFFLLLTSIYNRWMQSIFSWKPLVTIGQFSYSLYLIHLPFIHAAYRITQKFNWSSQTQFLFYQAFFMPLCIFLGYLFYRVAEKPFLKQKAKFTTKMEKDGQS